MYLEVIFIFIETGINESQKRLRVGQKGLEILMITDVNNNGKYTSELKCRISFSQRISNSLALGLKDVSLVTELS